MSRVKPDTGYSLAPGSLTILVKLGRRFSPQDFNHIG
jgi:hypothetical protein